MEELCLVACQLLALVVAVVTCQLYGDVTSLAVQQSVYLQRTAQTFVVTIGERFVVAAVGDDFAQVATVLHNLGHDGCVELIVDDVIRVGVECCRRIVAASVVAAEAPVGAEGNVPQRVGCPLHTSLYAPVVGTRETLVDRA